MNVLDNIKHSKLYKNICPSCNSKGSIGVGIEDNTFYCSCGKQFYATNKNLGAIKNEFKQLN